METLISISNYVGRLSIGSLDFLVVIVVLLGFHLGNRTGASKQIVSFVVWVLVLTAAAIGYQFLAPVFERYLGASPRFAPAMAYGFIATWVAVTLIFITKSFADRVEATTAFGDAEYVIGPVACAIRNTAILMVVIGTIHGIQVIPEHEKKYRAEQMQVYGMILYPTSGIVRDTVFGSSVTGRVAHEHLEFLLAKPNYTPSAPVTSFAAK